MIGILGGHSTATVNAAIVAEAEAQGRAKYLAMEPEARWTLISRRLAALHK